MPRNLDRRLEILLPIKNETVHAQVLDQIMMANYKDKKLSWELKDNTYTKIQSDKNAFSAHEYFMNNPSLSGQGKSIIKGSVTNLKI